MIVAIFSVYYNNTTGNTVEWRTDEASVGGEM